MAERTLRFGRLALPQDLGGVFVMDTANDLPAGLIGATAFVLVDKGTEWYQRTRAQPRRMRQRLS